MVAVGVAEDSSTEAEGSNTAVAEDRHDIAVHVVADAAEMACDLVGVEEVVPAQTWSSPCRQSDWMLVLWYRENIYLNYCSQIVFRYVFF